MAHREVKLASYKSMHSKKPEKLSWVQQLGSMQFQ